MPPRIYKSGIGVINAPQARQSVGSGELSINVKFNQSSLSLLSIASYFDIRFKPFLPTFTYSNTILTIPFKRFGYSFNVISGSVAEFPIKFPKTEISLLSSNTNLEAYVCEVTASGSCIVVPSINASIVSIETDLEGNVTGQANISITLPDETGSLLSTSDIYTGDLYLVVNLKTKSHTTYRDGNNNAIADLGQLSLGSQNLKNISDLYIHGRSTGTPEVIIKNNEETQRTYPVSFGVNDQAYLKNKKLTLSKGLRGTNWKLSLASKETDHLEVANIDLIVNKSKRRV